MIRIKSKQVPSYQSQYQPFKRQPHRMVKHTQTIRQLLLTNCLTVLDHFLGLALKELIDFRGVFKTLS